MARVTLDEVRDYQETSRSLEEALDEMLSGLLGQYDLTDEDTWGEVIDVCLDVFGRFGNASASLGSMFYQNCRDTQTDGTGSFVAEPYMDERLYGRLTNQIRRTLKTLKTDEKATVETVTNSIKYDVANLVELCNRDTIRENLRNENADKSSLQSFKEAAFKAMANAIASTPSTTPTGTRRARRTQPVSRSKVQFMRVPAADCSCTFCLIMAGRGAVYLNKKTAGDDTNKYHLHCRCSVVPVDSTDPVIAEYDYTKYEDMYYDAYDKLQALYDRKRAGKLTEEDEKLLKRIDDAHDAAEARAKKLQDLYNHMRDGKLTEDDDKLLERIGDEGKKIQDLYDRKRAGKLSKEDEKLLKRIEAKATGRPKSKFDLINEVEIVMRFYDTNLH